MCPGCGDDAPESAARLRAMLDGIAHPVGLLSVDGILLDANAAALDLIKALPAQVLGRPFWQTPWWLHSAILQQQLQDAVRAAAAGRTISFPATHLRHDGIPVHVEFSIRPAYGADGTVAWLVCEGSDLSEHRRLSGALMDSRIKYASLFRNSPDIVALTARDSGQFLEVNEAFERVLGFSRDETLGRTSLELGTWGDASDRTAMIAALAAGQGRLANFETRFRRKTGQTFTALLSCETVTLEAQPCLIIVARDISDRKQREDETRRTVVELTRSNQDLERFAYMAAHDLTEPCRAVVSFSQLLRRRLETGDKEGVSDLLDHLESGGRRMRDLVDAIMAYAAAGGSAEPPAPVHCQTLAAEALHELDAPPDAVAIAALPLIPGHAGEIRQLFAHLIDNGLKFRDDRRPPRVTIEAAPGDGGTWHIQVRDNGIGIAAEDLPGLFEPFRRLHPPGRYPGVGIGLALCRRIVEHHGGRIWIESTLGQGSCVHLTLPGNR